MQVNPLGQVSLPRGYVLEASHHGANGGNYLTSHQPDAEQGNYRNHAANHQLGDHAAIGLVGEFVLQLAGRGQHNCAGKLDIDAPFVLGAAHADRHEGLQQSPVRTPACHCLPLADPAFQIASQRLILLPQRAAQGDVKPIHPGGSPFVTDQQYLALSVVQRLIHLLDQTLQGRQRDIDPDHAKQGLLLQQRDCHRGHQHLLRPHIIEVGLEQAERLAANAATIPVVLHATCCRGALVRQHGFVLHLSFNLAVDPGPVSGEASLVISTQLAGTVVVAVLPIQLIGLEHRIDTKQVGGSRRRIVQLLIDGTTQRLGGAKIVGRILALKQYALSQQSGTEIGLIQIAGDLGRLLGSHRLHPVFGRALRLLSGGGQHLILHPGGAIKRRGNQGSSTGQ